MDRTEFDEFYQASFRRLVGQVYAMVGNWDEATECTQEAFVRAWQHRRSLDKDQSPEAWVRTTAHRLAISRWRRVKLSRRAPDRATGPAGTVAGPDPDRVAVVDALGKLPAGQRRVVVLHHLCDLPVAAIARETGVAEGTVKSQLSRGRITLAQLLGEPDMAYDAEGARHA